VFVASYRRASLQALAVLASEGIRVVFVLPPPRLDVATTDALPALYSQIAAQWPMFAQSYDAGALVSGPHRVFTHTLPCLPFEGPELGCHGGEIQVRSDDGVHFCPGTLRDPKNLWSGCSVWSSGSWRYAGGIVDAARAGLR
jgi:hypothetical protein